ncbi:MAG: ABC transporter ATP-binding protein [Planctomycetota bacterium]
MPMIEMTGVEKSLGGRKVLDGMSLSVEKGETLVIIGGSGAGKSVSLKHIVGLLRPDVGHVAVNGMDITDGNPRVLDDIRRRIGFLFQSGALLQSLTAGENVALPLREHTDLAEPEIQALVREKLALVRLGEAEHVMPANLSGGMRKRVSLARAIVRKPDIILYDEPTAGLDPVVANTINELIRNLQEKLGVTSVVVTHDMESAYRIGDRIAMLYKGRILEVGTPARIRASAHPVVRQFIRGETEGPLSEKIGEGSVT